MQHFSETSFKGAAQGGLSCVSTNYRFSFLLSFQLGSLIILVQSQLAMFPPLASHMSNFRSTLSLLSYSHCDDSTHLHTFTHQQRAPPSHEVFILTSHHDHQWVDVPLRQEAPPEQDTLLLLAYCQTESQGTEILELIIKGTCTSLDCGR